MARRDNNGSMDDGNFYQHWRGKRTKMADVITTAEVGILEEVVAPLQEEYHGPALGTRHEYPVARVSKVHSSEPPDWLVEERRLQRAAWWLQREADHARAMALDQAARELRRYHAAPEDVQPTFTPKPRRQWRQQRATMTIHCNCGHTGHVILSGRGRARGKCAAVSAANYWSGDMASARKVRHPGFAAVQTSIAKREGISADRAGAILASASRGASKAAKKANPRLKRVKG